MGDCKEDGVVGIAMAPIVCIAVMSFSCTGMTVVAFVDDKVADPAKEAAVETALWTVEAWKTDCKTMRRRAWPMVDHAAYEVDPAIVSQPLDDDSQTAAGTEPGQLAVSDNRLRKLCLFSRNPVNQNRSLTGNGV